MKRKATISFTIGLILLALSFYPMFLMIREIETDRTVASRYVVERVEFNADLNVDLGTDADHNAEQEVNILGQQINFLEEKTGRIASLTPWDIEEGVPPGEIVKVQIELNGEPIAEPTELWLSNRDRGSRYFSWLDVLTVHDRKTGEHQVAIVQRLTDDDERMDDRKWRIIYVNEAGEWEQETFGYRNRSEHPLGVKLVMKSNTRLMAMGYYSDIMQGYPNIIFPLLYPWLTTAIGILLVLIASVRWWMFRRLMNGQWMTR